MFRKVVLMAIGLMLIPMLSFGQGSSVSLMSNVNFIFTTDGTIIQDTSIIEVDLLDLDLVIPTVTAYVTGDTAGGVGGNNTVTTLDTAANLTIVTTFDSSGGAYGAKGSLADSISIEIATLEDGSSFGLNPGNMYGPWRMLTTTLSPDSASPAAVVNFTNVSLINFSRKFAIRTIFYSDSIPSTDATTTGQRVYQRVYGNER